MAFNQAHRGNHLLSRSYIINELAIGLYLLVERFVVCATNMNEVPQTTSCVRSLCYIAFNMNIDLCYTFGIICNKHHLDVNSYQLFRAEISLKTIT